MLTQISEWEKDQGIRLPEEVLHAAGFAMNDVLNVQAAGGVIILTPNKHHRTLEERASEYNGKLGLDGEYDWGEPVGREVW